jgi:hypothetical protein
MVFSIRGVGTLIPSSRLLKFVPSPLDVLSIRGMGTLIPSSRLLNFMQASYFFLDAGDFSPSLTHQGSPASGTD